MTKFKNIVKYLLSNFGPLIAFYSVVHFFNLKLAIVATLVVTAIELIYARYTKKRLTSFFYFSATIATVFGIIDLNLNEPLFFKLEAGISNLLFAFYFGYSLFESKSIIQEFAEQQGRIDQNESADKTYFFRFLTTAWVLYFIMKAAVYTWINFNSTVEHGLLLRILIGNLSLGLMLVFSIGFSKRLWRIMARMGWLPSARQNEKFSIEITTDLAE